MSADPRVRLGAGPARVVFFGSGAFATPILAALLDRDDVVVAGVVTAPDRPAGRGSALTATPVARLARERGLAVLQFARLRDAGAVEAIAALRPDLGVLADYGRIVPPDVLAIPPAGFLNVHPSLLPRHRGASPIPAAILEGDAESGVAVMAMDAGLDTGPVVASERWPLRADETAETLEPLAAAAGAALLVRILPAWLDGTATALPQDGAAATLTRPLRREDGRLDGREPAAVAARRVRALRPWPGTFLEFDDDAGRLAVLEAAAIPAHAADRPGILMGDGDGVALTTVDGRLRLDRVRPAGGKDMDGAAWRRGRPIPPQGRPVRGAAMEVTA